MESYWDLEHQASTVRVTAHVSSDTPTTVEFRWVQPPARYWVMRAADEANARVYRNTADSEQPEWCPVRAHEIDDPLAVLVLEIADSLPGEHLLSLCRRAAANEVYELEDEIEQRIEMLRGRQRNLEVRECQLRVAYLVEEALQQDDSRARAAALAMAPTFTRTVEDLVMVATGLAAQAGPDSSAVAP